MTDGFVLVDKPAGWTSHDVVAKVRRLLATRRVGHAGTLDPMATGVLVLGVGRATRLMSLAGGGAKTYVATIRLGESTSTDDAEGEVVARTDASTVPTVLVEAAMATLTGRLQQVPSSVSAIKVSGRTAHSRVRAGEEVELAAREVHVAEFSLLAVRPGEGVLDLVVRVRCGPGTYVRALARDLGAALGVGGHVTALRRTESSGVRVEECQDLDSLLAGAKVRTVADLIGRWVPIVALTDAGIADVIHGRRTSHPDGLGAQTGRDQQVAVADGAGEVVALARLADGMLIPAVVLVDAAKWRSEGGPT